MKVLKIHAEAPSAHFSVPYTILERKTYPIPMFSTVVGFICNALGDREKIDRFLDSEFSIAVVGDHKGVLEEYTWYRNFSKDYHKKRYFSPENRTLEEVEHPGGQFPVKVQTLVEPVIDIFVKASDDILELLYESFERMDRTISHLHIGRAEDILSDLKVEIVEVKVGKAFSTNGYTWLSSPICADVPSVEKYEKLYRTVIASVHKVSTLYKVIDGKRVFSHVQAKLHKGALPLVDYETVEASLCEGTPLFFTKIKGWGD